MRIPGGRIKKLGNLLGDNSLKKEGEVTDTSRNSAQVPIASKINTKEMKDVPSLRGLTEMLASEGVPTEHLEEFEPLLRQPEEGEGSPV